MIFHLLRYYQNQNLEIKLHYQNVIANITDILCILKYILQMIIENLKAKISFTA